MQHLGAAQHGRGGLIVVVVGKADNSRHSPVVVRQGNAGSIAVCSCIGSSAGHADSAGQVKQRNAVAGFGHGIGTLIQPDACLNGVPAVAVFCGTFSRVSADSSTAAVFDGEGKRAQQLGDLRVVQVAGDLLADGQLALWDVGVYEENFAFRTRPHSTGRALGTLDEAFVRGRGVFGFDIPVTLGRIVRPVLFGNCVFARRDIGHIMAIVVSVRFVVRSGGAEAGIGHTSLYCLIGIMLIGKGQVSSLCRIFQLVRNSVEEFADFQLAGLEHIVVGVVDHNRFITIHVNAFASFCNETADRIALRQMVLRLTVGKGE